MIPYTPKEHYSIADLVEVIRLLRSEDGCPWDKVQTHESIRPDLREETCEVIEAIDTNDTTLLREELGDLLLQVIFHAQIEQERGNFSFDDIVNDVCTKMVSRHAHVFGNVEAHTVDAALDSWDKIKAQSKHQETYTDRLTAVAKTLPALMYAQKVIRRAEKAPFFEKAYAASSLGECDGISATGVMLFALAKIAQDENFDAEQALIDETNRFIQTFAEQEEHENEIG